MDIYLKLFDFSSFTSLNPLAAAVSVMLYVLPPPHAQGLTPLIIYTAVVTILYQLILHYIVLHYTALHCVMLCCTALQSVM